MFVMKIGEVAKASGLRPSAVRYYEQLGLLPKAARAGGQRQYDGQVLERLAVVEFAKACGFTLSEVRALLTSLAPGTPLAPRLQLLAEGKLAELDAEAKAIESRRKRIRHALQCHCSDLSECGRRILVARSSL
jgi:MerR family redox-sensitive transcriptional activator SoxR